MNDHRRIPGRRGSAYLLVLCLAAMVAVIGMGAMGVARVHLRNSANREAEAEAEILSMSAIEQALAVIDAAADAADAVAGNWRDGFTHGQLSPARELGAGTVEWYLMDATGDADLSGSDSDAILLYGRGTVGEAVRLSSVLLTPAGEGLEVLQTALHTAGDVVNDDRINASGGVVSVGGTLYNYDTIQGDVDAGSIAVMGSISGAVNTPAPPKDMPPASLFQTYRDRATRIDWYDFDAGGGQFDPGLLSAAVNPYGDVNDDGVYWIHTPGWGQLKIRAGRIRGTLVLSGEPGAKIKLKDKLVLEPHRPDYPAVLAGGPGVQVELGWVAGPLSEGSVGVNLNPAHTPYEGESDADIADQYVPGITGLVHIFHGAAEPQIGDSVVDLELVVNGTLLSEADVDIKSHGMMVITVDPALFVNPPDGYARGNRVAPLLGTWRWETLP